MSALHLRGVRSRRRVVWGGLALFGALLAGGCSRHAGGDVEVEVSRVAMDPASRSPVVVLEDKAHTMALPIWIGPAEAQAIAVQLQGIESPRPLTHDLMKNVLDRIGVGLRRVVIGDLRDNTYYAHIVLHWHGTEVEIDSRPSDAIALAVRFQQPIFVSRPLMERENVVALRSPPGAAELTVSGVTVQALSDDLADFFGLPHGGGVLVADVVDDEGDGLRRGDVVLEIDGRAVSSPEDFRARIAARTRADLAVQRNGARIHVALAGANDD